MAPDIDPKSYDHSEIDRYGTGKGTTYFWITKCCAVALCVENHVSWLLLLLLLFANTLTPWADSLTTPWHFSFLKYLRNSPICGPVLQDLFGGSVQKESRTTLSVCLIWNYAQRVPEIFTTWPSGHWLHLFTRFRHPGGDMEKTRKALKALLVRWLLSIRFSYFRVHYYFHSVFTTYITNFWRTCGDYFVTL